MSRASSIQIGVTPIEKNGVKKYLIMVFGNTYPVKDVLKQNGFRYNPASRNWFQYVDSYDIALDIISNVLPYIDADVIRVCFELPYKYDVGDYIWDGDRPIQQFLWQFSDTPIVVYW